MLVPTGPNTSPPKLDCAWLNSVRLRPPLTARRSAHAWGARLRKPRQKVRENWLTVFAREAAGEGALQRLAGPSWAPVGFLLLELSVAVGPHGLCAHGARGLVLRSFGPTQGFPAGRPEERRWGARGRGHASGLEVDGLPLGRACSEVREEPDLSQAGRGLEALCRDRAGAPCLLPGLGMRRPQEWPLLPATHEPWQKPFLGALSFLLLALNFELKKPGDRPCPAPCLLECSPSRMFQEQPHSEAHRFPKILRGRGI